MTLTALLDSRVLQAILALGPNVSISDRMHRRLYQPLGVDELQRSFLDLRVFARRIA